MAREVISPVIIMKIIIDYTIEVINRAKYLNNSLFHQQWLCLWWSDHTRTALSPFIHTWHKHMFWHASQVSTKGSALNSNKRVHFCDGNKRITMYNISRSYMRFQIIRNLSQTAFVKFYRISPVYYFVKCDMSSWKGKFKLLDVCLMYLMDWSWVAACARF